MKANLICTVRLGDETWGWCLSGDRMMAVYIPENTNSMITRADFPLALAPYLDAAVRQIEAARAPGPVTMNTVEKSGTDVKVHIGKVE